MMARVSAIQLSGVTMAGFIGLLKGLSRERQAEEIRQKIEDSLAVLAQSDEVVVLCSDMYSDSCGIDDWSEKGFEIGVDEVRVKLNFTVSGTRSSTWIGVKGSIEGTSSAIIDDDGRVHYCDVNAAFTTPAETPIRRSQAELSEVGSKQWYDYWLALEWTTARSGSGATHETVNGHELGVHEDEYKKGTWNYGIQLCPPDPMTWRSVFLESEWHAKCAALKELAELLS